MKNKTKYIFLGLSLIFFLLMLINLYFSYNSYMLTIDSWTRIPSIVILFSLAGLNITIYICFIIKRTSLKLLVGVLGIVSLLFVSFIGLFVSDKIRMYHNEGYVIYIQEDRFLFAGEDRYYIKENPFIARYIGSGYQGEECNTTYFIEDGVFYINEKWESGNVDVTTVHLD